MMSRLLIFILGVFVAPAMTYASIYGTLIGKVTDSEGKPVSGASVRVEGTTRGAYAKADGSYIIANITAGTYNVRVTGVGYKENIQRLTISADQTFTHNVKLQSDVVQTGGVTVVAQRDVDPTEVGTINTISTADLTNVPRETVQGVVLLQPGVIQSGNGFVIRGSRPTETQIRVDGFDVGDQFSGGLGNVAALNEYPTVSNFATEEVQVLTGSFGVEYGKAMGGIVNTVVKTGKTDSYEGLIRYRTDLGALNGSANGGPGDGLKLEEKGLNTFEGNIGGPIPFLGSSTFFLSGKYETQQFRDNGFAVLDLLGNNLGQLPNNSLWLRNITGRMRFAVTDDIGLIVGGMFGLTSRETSSWAWLYSNKLGATPATSGVEERRAKQAVVDQLIENAFVRVNHSLNESSFYEFSLSTNINENSVGRRASFDDPSFFGGFELMEATDNKESTLGTLIDGSDLITDQYSLLSRNRDTVVFGDSANPVTISDYFVNPLTGYIEGGSDATSTNNPYGLPNFFNATGSGGGFETRKSNYFQADGSYTANFGNPDDFRHTVKAGFEARFFSISHLRVSNPEASNPFFDIYGFPNFYAENEKEKQRTSEAYTPITGALFVQDQITYKGIIISPGLRFDFTDPRARYRSTNAQFGAIDFVPISSDTGFAETSAKYQFSPRLFIAYPITERSALNISYGIYFQMPQFNDLFDAFNTERPRGNMILGNPNLEAQQTKAYQVGYDQQITDDFSGSITAYYKDIYNQSGIRFVNAFPAPYAEIANAEYGNSRGIEFSLRKRPTDHIGLSFNYTLSSSRGTSSATGTNYTQVFLAGADEATGKKTFPLTESYLSFDRRHSINTVVDFLWGRDEGPSVGGIYLLENTNINFTGTFQSGTPYTKRGKGGNQIGDYNGERQPSVWRVDSRIQKSFPLSDFFGESVQNLSLDVFMDITNIFNRTEAVAVYDRTGSPDNDGESLNRQPSEIAGDNIWYKNPTASTVLQYKQNLATQYDTFRNLLYNERIDFNKDGAVTREERYQSYQQLVQTVQSRRANYQAPRQFWIGAMLRF